MTTKTLREPELGPAGVLPYKLTHRDLLARLVRFGPLTDSEMMGLLECCDTQAVKTFLYGYIHPVNPKPYTRHPPLNLIPKVIALLETRNSTWWEGNFAPEGDLTYDYLVALLEQVPGLAWHFTLRYPPFTYDRDLTVFLTEHFVAASADLDTAWTLFEDHRNAPPEQAISLSEFCSTLAALARVPRPRMP
jgi:hypothetical protein